jgi:hypothetical protein
MSASSQLTLVAAVVASVPALGAQQQAPLRRVEARVSALSGNSVHLDQGSDAGIEPGDRVRATPTGGAPVELIVRAATRQSARCEFVGGPALLDVGALVEVFVPEDRTSGGGALPWRYAEEGWNTNLPLLAPVQGVMPSERERTWTGRLFQSADWTTDRAGAEQDYLFARTGLGLRVDNVGGRGDQFGFDGELFHRFASIDGQDEESTVRGRIDRLSWRFDDSRERSQRLELGRFLSSEMPQLGVIDGVEFVQRTESGARYGASVGLLPAWNSTLSTGDDVQAALFYRTFAGAEQQFTAGAAVQKTWHEGKADRDLVVGDFSWRASESWRFSGATSIDIYGGDEAPKSSGAELTELHLAAFWSPKASHAATLTYSHIAWPLLLRDELPPITAATLADGVVDRVALSAWRDLTKRVRLWGRLDQWRDEDQSGGGGEVRVSWRDLVVDSSEVSAALFTGAGQVVDVNGARVGWRQWGGWGAWFATFELAKQDLGAGGEVDANVLRGGWDGSLGRDWMLSLHADLRTGDEQDALTLGFLLQRRF